MTGPQGPPGLPGNYALLIDLQGAILPLGWHPLLGGYFLRNSEGIAAKVRPPSGIASTTGTVTQSFLYFDSLGTHEIYFADTGCAGEAYSSDDNVPHGNGNGIALLQTLPGPNADGTIKFWRYNLTQSADGSIVINSRKSANGTCTNISTGATLMAYVRLIPAADLTFRNAFVIAP